jgi:hypothetical protein
MSRRRTINKSKEIASGRRKIRTVRLEFIESKTDTENLGDLSITFDNTDFNFSFESENSDLEPLENPNLLNKSENQKLKSSLVSPKDKFDEDNDPFFDIDENIPISNTPIKNVNTRKLKTVASKLVKTNTKTRYKK